MKYPHVNYFIPLEDVATQELTTLIGWEFEH